MLQQLGKRAVHLHHFSPRRANTTTPRPDPRRPTAASRSGLYRAGGGSGAASPPLPAPLRLQREPGAASGGKRRRWRRAAAGRCGALARPCRCGAALPGGRRCPPAGGERSHERGLPGARPQFFKRGRSQDDFPGAAEGLGAPAGGEGQGQVQQAGTGLRCPGRGAAGLGPCGAGLGL